MKWPQTMECRICFKKFDVSGPDKNDFWWCSAKCYVEDLEKNK